MLITVLVRAADSATIPSSSAGAPPAASKTSPVITSGGSMRPVAASEAIEAAKREFDAIKAVRDPSQQQSSALPRLTMPELHIGAAEPKPLISPRPEKTDPTASKSTNWLVDAMQRDARQQFDRERARGGRGTRTGRELRAGNGEETSVDDTIAGPAGTGRDATNSELATNDRPVASAARGDREANATEAAAATNPLTRYLGEWLTPQDYAILKPGLDESFSGRAGTSDREASAWSGALPVGVTGGSATAYGLLAPAPPAFSIPQPRENPYLQMEPAPVIALSSAPPPFAESSPAQPPPMATPPTMPAPNPTPPATVKSQIPEFAKPALDEKYFKPLKRF